MRIKQFPFNKNCLKEIESLDTKKIKYGTNWPVVYILSNKNKAYIGETLSAYNRMKQHLDNPKRDHFNTLTILLDDEFNKSSILDIESWLIKYMGYDKKLDNSNKGLRNHDYYGKEKVINNFSNIWNLLKNKNLVKSRLIDIENSDFFAYSPYKVLSHDQILAVDKILKELKIAIKNNENLTILINGSAGTGKTVVATYLMKLLKTPSEVRFGEKEEDIDFDDEFFKTIDSLEMAMVVPQQSLRKTLQNVFKKVNDLKSSDVIKPYEVPTKNYDLLIVDEAHRLQRPINLGRKYNAYHDHVKKMGLSDESTELEWIINQSKYQILFYDKNQTVRPTDIREQTFNDLLKNRKVINIELTTQMRVKADEDYVGYIKNILSCNCDKKENFTNYEFKLYDDFHKMRKDIIDKNNDREDGGYSRIVAGYSWKWLSNNNKELYDIEIDNEKMRWNSTLTDWINSKDSINEVGCIHTVQGYDLNYCGVIIGKEIDYDFNRKEIVIYKDKYKDTAGKIKIENEEELLKYIKNIYLVLLTRGIKGTYVYVHNENMKKYLEGFIEK